MFEFVVKELGYSEGAACRRIGAMRLLFSLPEPEKNQVEAALNEGQVSLSNLSSVQRFCRAENIPTAEKFYLVKQTVDKTQCDTDRLLAARSSKPFKVEKIRPLSDTLTELRITLTNDQLAKLERAKEILSNQTNSWAELFVVMSEQLIKNSEPKARDLKKAAPSKNPVITPAPELVTDRGNNGYLTPAPKSRYIPKNSKLQLLERAQHQCEYADSETGRRCTARDHLEVDHIQPLALGGKNDANNLRVLCRAHNSFEALKSFGAAKMDKHWKNRAGELSTSSVDNAR